MKTQITKIKLSLAFCLMFVLPLATFAATPPPDPAIYMCGSGAVTLGYSGTSAYALVTGDKVIWQEQDATGAPVGTAQTKTSDGTPGSVALTITGGTPGTGEVGVTAAGAHYWVATVIAASGTCTGDVSSPTNVYLLPTFSVDLTPSTTTYCAAATTKATITASANLLPVGTTIPAEVTFSYDWTGSTGGAVDGTNGNIYNMTAGTAGDYNISVKADFKVPAGKLLKSSAGGCGTTKTTTYTVSPTPGAPTITFS